MTSSGVSKNNLNLTVRTGTRPTTWIQRHGRFAGGR